MCHGNLFHFRRLTRTMEEYEAYIDQLPEKILKTLAEANGHPPSEEELREIYEAHRELKENVEKLKQEMNGNVQQFEIFSEKSKTDEEANALDLVTDLMQSCGIPCDEEVDEALTSDGIVSVVNSKTSESRESVEALSYVPAGESIENNEAIDGTDCEGDSAYGIDFKQLEYKDSNTSPRDNRYKLTTRHHDIDFNAQK